MLNLNLKNKNKEGIFKTSISLENYLKEVKDEKILAVEEELNLFRKIKKGDEKAVEKILKANLRFVLSVAKQYQGLGLDISDLIAEGNIGLIEAVSKFDETRGVKFISYAVWWIRKSILEALYKESKMTLRQVHLLSKIKKHSQSFEQKNFRLPTEDELAKLLNIKPEKISETLLASKKSFSLNNPLFDDNEDKTILDYLKCQTFSSPDDLANKSTSQDLWEIFLNKLPSKDKEFISLCFGIHPYRESSEGELERFFGYSTYQVRAKKRMLLTKLRDIIPKEIAMN